MDKIGEFLREEWPVLLPVVLGFLAVYWLLPRVQRDWLIPGSLAGAAALVSAGLFLIKHEFAVIEAVLFYSFSGMAILGAALMLAQHSPVRAAMSFALVVLSTCGLFLLLAAPFLMAATIIIYGGAIIITFLFVIMLAQQIGTTSADLRSREPLLASLACFVLLASVLIALYQNYETRAIDGRFALVEAKLDRVIALNGKNQKALDDILEENVAEKRLVEELDELMPHHNEEVVNILENKPADLVESQKLCKKLKGEIEQMRHRVGSLWPSRKLTSFSDVPANKSASTETKETMPHDNVAALGRSLFTEYLVAVELTGMLLLVATIGAIVIAGRREGDETAREVLR